jgi:hypothetical protein
MDSRCVACVAPQLRPGPSVGDPTCALSLSKGTRFDRRRPEPVEGGALSLSKGLSAHRKGWFANEGREGHWVRRLPRCSPALRW